MEQKKTLAALIAVVLTASASAADWQWSVPEGAGRAFLWIPPDCRRVRAVVVGQNNMLEEGMLEHAALRRTLAQLGIAEVFVAPPFDPVFRFDRGAGERFETMMQALSSTTDPRSADIWLLAKHPGDASFQSAVQQAVMHLPANTGGAAQRLLFPEIPDQRIGGAPVRLRAVSDAGVPVGYYVREGPAEIDGDTLRFTPIPPRARLPIQVTVVAWQLGRATEPRLNAAAPVVRTFNLLRRP